MRPVHVVLAMLLSACTEGATDDPALSSMMRVDGAQFVPGKPPAPSGGPSVESIDLLTNTIWPGYDDKLLTGALGPTATSALVDLVGDDGYWIVLSGPPDVSTPTLPSFRATAQFATTLLPGAYTLEVRAVDVNGLVGSASTQPLTALDGPPGSALNGALVVTLTWDTESDLDLHVVDPLGNEIFHGNPTSANAYAPGGSTDQNPGILDVDSNANCVIDGRRQEDVTWATDPPSGKYLVRVDAASLCGQVIAHYQVRALLHGKSVGAAEGIALDQDTWGAHDRGAGTLVLTFDVP